MLKNYLKIALRNLLKNKIFSLINIMGLAIGMAACLLILQYVNFELSYDRFAPEAEQIYRVTTVNFNNDEMVYQDAMSFNAVGPTLKDKFPEVLDFARAFKPFMGFTFRHENELYSEEQIIMADPSFIDMFGYQVVEGDANNPLKEPYSLVLTRQQANKYFGSQNPIGKSLRVPSGQYAGDYKVTAVMEDVPENTHLKFSMIVSYNTNWSIGQELNWTSFNDYTYIKVQQGTSLAALQEKINPITKEFLSEKTTLIAYLQPMTDIHLHSNMSFEAETNGNAQAVYFLLIISIFIIFIAWVNYINLSTAKAVERAREVGIRKALGAAKKLLMRQFLLESLLLNLLASIIALTIIQLSWPFFSAIFNKNLPAPLGQPEFWIILSALFLVGSVCSGIYPAFVLSSFKPLVVLRGKYQRSTGGVVLRKSLVIFQFAASVFLLAGTAIVYKQITFMQQHDLGMNVDQVLVLRAPQQSAEDTLMLQRFRTFKNEVERLPAVENLTTSVSIPAGGSSNIGSMSGGIWWDQNITDQKLTYYLSPIDENYLNTYEIDLLAGRNFSRDMASDTGRVFIINDAARKLLGFENPEQAIDEYIKIGTNDNNPKWRIIGVIDDFNRQSLKNEIEPTLFRFISNGNGQYYSAKLSTDELGGTLAAIQQSWKQVYPDAPFDYFFADEKFDQQYRSDFQFGQVFGLFSVLAMIIACMGLYGLSSFMSSQRTKEIGVRKVLGASISQVLILLTSDFLKLMLISFVIGIPLVLYIMNEWLNSYAFRTDMAWWIFALAGLAVLLLVLMTVSFKTIQVARTNPARSLRYE